MYPDGHWILLGIPITFIVYLDVHWYRLKTLVSYPTFLFFYYYFKDINIHQFGFSSSSILHSLHTYTSPAIFLPFISDFTVLKNSPKSNFLTLIRPSILWR